MRRVAEMGWAALEGDGGGRVEGCADGAGDGDLYGGVGGDLFYGGEGEVRGDGLRLVFFWLGFCGFPCGDLIGVWGGGLRGEGADAGDAGGEVAA